MQSHFTTRTLTQDEFNAFAGVSGDNNPIHVDPVFSARTRFGHTVSHGMLLYTVLWGLVLRQYPGAVQVSQTMMFPNPAFAGEPLEFRIAEHGTSGSRCILATMVRRLGDGAAVLDGQTEIQLP